MERRLHSWNQFLLAHHVHDFDLLRLIVEVGVDHSLQEASVSDLVSMIDIEGLKQTINFHKNVALLSVLVVLEAPVINFLEDL